MRARPPPMNARLRAIDQRSLPSMQGWLKRWILPEGAGARPMRGTLVQRVAAARGIAGDALAGFTAPTFDHLKPPDDLFGAVEVGARLSSAVRAGKRIAIFGDYDADGMCAAAILVHLIRHVQGGEAPRVFIPERATEGYGLSMESVRRLAVDGAQVLVSVDCGITALDEVALARDLGLEVLITDHHAARSDGRLPDAHAIAHPAFGGGDGTLCGAAVAWKVGLAFCRAWCGSDHVTPELRELLVETLALAAFGTVADIVPLVGENRVITRLGMARIARSGLPGLRALAEQAGIGPKDSVDSERISFGLAPILNACGRLGSAMDGMQLLALPHMVDGTDASHERQAAQWVQRFAALNERRKAEEREIFEQALERQEEGLGAARGACVLADPLWSRGIVGTACARLADRLHVPVVLMQLGGGMAHGSARSIDGYSILGGLEACAEHLERFGGHAAAAGVAVAEGNVMAFREALSAHAAAHRPATAGPSVRADVKLVGGDISAESFAAVQALGPFGRGFPAPTVWAQDAVITSTPRIFGKDRDHISFFVRLGDLPTAEISCIWWRQASQSPRLTRGLGVQIIGSPQVDSWSGRHRPALQLADVADCA